MNALKLLFNPIFLLAAGLHAGLLLIPVAGGSSEGLVPAPDPEGESITVTRIPPKAAKPAKPNTGQTAAPKANLPATTPATTTQVPTGGKPTNGTNNNQQRSQSNTRSQSGQQRSSGNGSSSSRASNSGSQANSSRRNSRNNRSNQTARNNQPSGLPDLPNDTNTVPNTVPVTVPSEDSTQKTPTLTALREGANSQGIPRLLKDFLARLQYSLQETRDVATVEAQQAWLAKLEKDQPDIQVSTPQELDQALEINYPLEIENNGPRLINSCLNPLPKTGLIGVVVDENGEITTEPMLLRSSGYPLLNDIALGKIKDYNEFPDDTTQKIYTVPVEVKYDEETCVSLAKLGVVPPEPESRTPSTPPEGSRNFLEEDDSPSPFGR